MSRKLLYVAGLLNCFYFHTLFKDAETRRSVFSEEEQHAMIVDIFRSEFGEPPLDIVAVFLSSHEHLYEIAARLFGAYDEFLGILLDKNQRTHFDKLAEDAADADAQYLRARLMSHRFRDALLDLFFDQKTGLYELTRMYGIF
jgi:hypothetical protein